MESKRSAGRNDAALRKDTRSLRALCCGDRVFVQNLRALCCGDRVFVQNQTGNYPHKWDKVWTVVEVPYSPLINTS